MTKREAVKEELMVEEEPKPIKIKKIADIPGVGPTTLEKLNANGYYDLLSIAATPIIQITAATGLGEVPARKIIQIAREALDLGFGTARSLELKREKMVKITTGFKPLDELIGGGYEPGVITELAGEFGSSKTQLAHILSVNTIKQNPKNVVIYIDSESCFRPDRLRQLAKGIGLNQEIALKQVKVARALNSDHQMLLVNKVEEMIGQGEKNIKVIIVDSVMAHFRAEFCLSEGMKVLTSKGLRDIENVQIGDRVVTHTNKLRKVLKTFKRKESEILELVIIGRPNIQCTPEHPFYVLRGQGQFKFVEAKDLKERDCLIWKFDNSIRLKNKISVHKEIDCNYESGKSFIGTKPRINEYQRVMELKQQGRTTKDIHKETKVPEMTIYSWLRGAYNPEHKALSEINDEIEITENFMNLIGMYLSEGTITRRQVKWCFGHQEDYLAARAVKYIKDIFGLKASMKTYGSELRVVASSRVLAELFKSWFSTTQSVREIPEFMMKLQPRLQKSLLAGYFVGDGHKCNYQTGLTTISPIMSHQLMVVAARIGYIPGMKIDLAEKETHHDKFRITLLNNKKNHEVFSGAIGYKINKINKKSYIGTVHNLTVEKDNSYSANGIITHNCGMGTLAPRQQKLNKHIHDLMRVADLNGIIVLITNQVMANPGIMFGNPLSPVGGNILGHACVCSNSIVMIEKKGLKRIKDVNVGEKIYNGEKFVKILHKSKPMIKDTLEIRSNGMINASLEHKFPVLGKGDVEAKDLKVGDILTKSCQIDFEGLFSEIPLKQAEVFAKLTTNCAQQIKNSLRGHFKGNKGLEDITGITIRQLRNIINQQYLTNLKVLINLVGYALKRELTTEDYNLSESPKHRNITIPKVLNETIIRLYASWLCDGDKGNKYSIIIRKQQKQYLEYLARLVEKDINIKTRITKIKDKNCYQLAINSTELVYIMNNLDIKQFALIDEDLIFNFCGAMIDCDGSISRSIVSFSQMDKELIDILQMLMLRLGIQSNIRKTKQDHSWAKGDYLYSFNVVQGNHSDYMQAKIKLVQNMRNREKVDKCKMGQFKLKKGFANEAKIMSIESSGEKEVIDITVEGEYFLANGIITHNSSSRLFLRKGKKGSRVAKLIDSPNCPDGEVNYFVEKEGLKEV